MTSYMMQNKEQPVIYHYVSLDHISRYMLAATIAHEDQQLGTRFGAFDVKKFFGRIEAYSKDEKDPYGSTIPQQLTKNIFLWSGQSAGRKGLEAVLATEFAVSMPKKRLLELYLNYAQFGPQIYGVCAATWYYFNTPPSRMTPNEAAQLMGVLPAPERVQRAPNGGLLMDKTADRLAVRLINGAAKNWVPKQIAGMGGWKKAVATVGITDTAADHAEDTKDNCSTMPEDVFALLVSQSGN